MIMMNYEIYLGQINLNINIMLILSALFDNY